jgi:hypothetical protein
MADLPTDNRIRLILPREVPKELRRCPTARDMQVLFQLLAEIQTTATQDSNPREIVFASVAKLLRRIGLASRDKNRLGVHSSLAYWSKLSIRYQQWWEHGQSGVRGKQGQRIRRVLPPPVTNVRRIGNRIAVTLDRQWIQLATSAGYFQPIPLPLPSKPAAQNLSLLILTSTFRPEIYGDLQCSYKRRQRWLTRKLGLDHTQRNRTFAEATEEVQNWFEDNGGDLLLVKGMKDGVLPRGDVNFAVTLPKIPRKKRPPLKPKTAPDLSLGASKKAPNLNPTKTKLIKTVRKG